MGERHHPEHDEEAEAPGLRRGDAPDAAGVDLRAQTVLSLQRSVGNHAMAGLLATGAAPQVARQYGPNLPPGPVGSLIGSLMRGPSTLEMVRDRLSYGVADWAITDEDVASATRMLGDMGDGELTDAVNSLDGDSTPYLDRLVDNATLPTVRTTQFAKIMRKRAPARNRVLAEQLVSYGFADWEVTPAEAEAAQTLLDALPAADSERLTDDWMKNRIAENLHKEGDYEQGVGEMLLDGAVQGDFQEDPTFWNTIGSIVMGCVPYAGQVADARDLVASLDKIVNKGGWKSGWEWANLVLVVVGFIPGAGDAVKALGKSALRGLRHAGLKVLGGLFDVARRHLIDPIVKHLVKPVVESVKDVVRRVVHEVDERVQRFLKGGEPHPHGEGKVIDEAADAAPNPAKLEADADQAINDAASGAGRRLDDVASEFVHSVIEALKDWCRRIFGDLGIGEIRVVIDGEWLELQGSKLIRVRIKAVKEILVQKSESIFSKIKERQGKLTAAKLAANDAAKNLLRNDACLVSEEIGERIAEVVMKREFPGATVKFRGKGSGVVDQVFEHGGLLYVVEAKGGGSRLGWREIGADEFAQQGTLAYLDDVIRNMMGSADQATRDIAIELAAKRKKGEVMYMIAKTGPLNASSEPIKAKLLTIRQ